MTPERRSERRECGGDAEARGAVARKKSRYPWDDQRDGRIKAMIQLGDYSSIADAMALEFEEEIDARMVQRRCLRLGLKRRDQVCWTDELDAALKGFLAAGLSHREAADAINRKFGTSYSRNAAIGRARRLNVVSRMRTPSLTSEEKSARKQRRLANRRAKYHARKPDRMPKILRPARAETLLECSEIVPLHASLLDLTKEQCRWPYGDGPFTFCGHASHEKFSYCKPHLLLSFGAERSR